MPWPESQEPKALVPTMTKISILTIGHHFMDIRLLK